MKTRELMSAFAVIANHLPGRYDGLENALSDQPNDVQLEFHRLVRAFEQRLMAERRRAREPWRR
jgi:hypothetical protein